MDFGLIFRTGDPLDRKHYLVGNLILWVFLGTVLLLGYNGVKLIDGTDKLAYGFAMAVLLAVAACILLFRLRRIVDIGFKNWNSAGLALIVCGVVAVVAGRIHPTAQLAVVAAFEIALLILPTGWNIRKDIPPVPPKSSW
ncbi:hypothetical protein ACC778_32915 [Rhizobium ruizarguesonis]